MAKLRVVVFSGLFVGLFMFLFQPFGLINIQYKYKTLFLLGYGLVTMFALAVMIFVFPKVFSGFFCEKNWTVGKQLFFSLLIILFIGVGNYFYSALVFHLSEQWWKALLMMMVFTMLIGVFPVGVIILLAYNKYLRQNIREATQVNAGMHKTGIYREVRHGEMITFPSSNRSDEPVTLSVDDFLFVRSDGNYLEVYFSEPGGQQRRLIRNTLSGIESLLHKHFPPLMRCHRSYIVNLSKVEKVDGNAQGLLLKLKNCDVQIPVSRKFIPVLRSKLS